MTNAAQHESPVVTALCSRKKRSALPSEHFSFFLFLKDATLSNLVFIVLFFYNKMVSGHIHSVLMCMSKQLLKCVKAWGAPTACCEGR